MPEMVPMGTENEIALGRISEGLCTSSAMLVTIARIQTEGRIRARFSLTHTDRSVRVC